MNLEKAKQQQQTLQEIIDNLEVTLYRVLKSTTITSGKNVITHKSVGQRIERKLQDESTDPKELRKLIEETRSTIYRYVKEVRKPLDSDICNALEDEDFTLVFDTPFVFPKEDNEYYYFKNEKIAQGYAEGLYEIVDGEIGDLDNYDRIKKGYTNFLHIKNELEAK
jgi:hypothetical protein